MKGIHIVLITFLAFIFTEMLLSCAQIVAPTGGKKDTLAPKLVRSFPVNQSKNFRGKMVELQFDEYTNVDNIQQQLLITPNIEGSYSHKIMPKGVRVTFDQPFRENTTYSLNFREAIKDITERNPAKNVRIVFSTGNVIDSIRVEGNVVDMFEDKGVLDATVGLYVYSDTLTPTKIKPYYFTKTDSSGHFVIENIKAGKYRVFAVTDGNNNLLFDETKEKIGFITDTLNLEENKTNISLYLARINNVAVKVLKTRATANYYYIELNRGIKQTKIQFEKKEDSLTYQLENPRTLKIYNTKGTANDTTKVKLILTDSLDRTVNIDQKIRFRPKGKKEESVKESFKYDITPRVGDDIDLKEMPYTIVFNKPIKYFDPSKIQILNDTLKQVPLKAEDFTWNEGKTELRFKPQNPIKPKEQVELRIAKETFISIENDTNSTVKNLYPLRDPENYGVIAGKVTNPSKKDCIVQILNENRELVRELFMKGTGTYTFDYLKAGQYTLRLIVDNNGNKRWDSGSLEKNQLPESVLHIKDKIKLKQNFELSGFDFQVE